MPIRGKYLVVKDKNDAITYYELDNMNGLDVTPKANVKIKDGVEVNKMVVINPSMVDKVIEKKSNKRFDAIVKHLIVLYDEEDDDEGTANALNHLLNEVAKLKQEYKNKYRMLMTKEKQEAFENKISVLDCKYRETDHTIDNIPNFF